MSADLHPRRLVLVLLVALAAGCGGDDGQDSTRADGDRRGATGEGAPAIEVADAGAEPRRMLQLDVSPGDEMASRMDMDMSVATSVDGNAAPEQDIPTIRFVMGTTVEEASAEEITASFEYRTAEVVDGGADPGLAAQLEERLAPMTDVRGRLTFAPNGALVDGDIDTPKGLDPSLASIVDQLEQQLGSLAQPFPEEPVGVGARWSATADLELGGIEWTQRTSYTLKRLDGERYVIGLELQQTMRPGPIEDATAGATAELVAGKSNSSGRNQGSLSSLMPLHSAASGTSEQTIEVSEGGEAQRLELDMDVEVELAPAG